MNIVNHKRLTSADDDVALEMNSAALGELEHGDDGCVGTAVGAVVLEVADDGVIGTASAIHQLDAVVGVTEAEASFHSHTKLT